eukprot:2803138-Rhodomonas_salina.1
MGSNLRGDYYYPTARKRYLPRVKRAYDELVPIREELANKSEDWDKIKTYAKVSANSGTKPCHVSTRTTQWYKSLQNSSAQTTAQKRVNLRGRRRFSEDVGVGI